MNHLTKFNFSKAITCPESVIYTNRIEYFFFQFFIFIKLIFLSFRCSELSTRYKKCNTNL